MVERVELGCLMCAQSLTRSSFLRQLSEDGPQSEVWEELCERYGEWITRWCRRWGATEPDAEDLTQETLLRVYMHIQNYRHAGPFSFRSWIRTVARTTWLMLLRHRSRRPVLQSFEAEGCSGIPEGGMESRASVFHERLSSDALRMERQELLAIAFRRVQCRVSEQSWRVFELATLAGQGAEEVSRVLGMSRSSVHLANSRLRRMLREELELVEGHGGSDG
jgi:RNA polymerase sigma-70 factor (ECF subfamily)